MFGGLTEIEIILIFKLSKTIFFILFFEIFLTVKIDLFRTFILNS